MLYGRTASLHRKRLQTSHVNGIRLWMSTNQQLKYVMSNQHDDRPPSVSVTQANPFASGIEHEHVSHRQTLNCVLQWNRLRVPVLQKRKHLWGTTPKRARSLCRGGRRVGVSTLQKPKGILGCPNLVSTTNAMAGHFRLSV